MSYALKFAALGIVFVIIGVLGIVIFGALWARIGIGAAIVIVVGGHAVLRVAPGSEGQGGARRPRAHLAPVHRLSERLRRPSSDCEMVSSRSLDLVRCSL